MSWLITPSFTQWSPADITTALWLDAADASTVTTVSGAVSQWNDKSGNGRNASQATAGNRPVYTAAGLNSKNVVTLTAANQHFLQFSDININDNNTFVISVVNRPSAGFNNVDVATLPGSIGYGNYWFNDNILYSLLRGVLNEFGTHGTASTVTGTFIQALSRNNTGTQAWRNGALLGTRQQSSATGNVILNSIGRVSNTYNQGYVAEIIVGRFNISDLDRQKTEGYLAHKWGLTASLPADHPYKVNPPAP